MKYYLASPFFTQEQRNVLEQLERHSEHHGIDFFSPRLECYCPPDAPEQQRSDTFNMNCEGIISSDFVLARIDDFDPGTVWEIGYAFAMEKFVYAFTTVPGRGLNLMLSKSCKGFLKELPSVFRFLEEMKASGSDREAQLWKGNII